jgi:hypothetical protein
VLLLEEEQLLQAATLLPKKSSHPSGDKNLKRVITKKLNENK